MLPVLFYGSMILVSIAFNVLWHATAYKRALVKDEISDAQILKIRNAYWFGFLVYLIAFILTFFYALAGLIICISFWAFWITLDYNEADRKKRRTKI